VSVSFTGFHWGDAPHRRLSVRCVAGRAKSAGEIAAVSYATTKDGKANIWRHEFKAPRPELLVVERQGDREPETPPEHTIEVGRLVDLELADGRRITQGLGYLCTSRSGSGLFVGVEAPVIPTIAIAGGGFAVEDRGIVH